MWHEARRQEKKIRGLIVDYRKRAERRREFYEKIRSDPAQFLQIHGRPLKIHIDSAITQAADNCLMPWRGNENNMIDRFDVRAHLDNIDDELKLNVTRDENEDDNMERQINYERWRNLVQNDFLGVSESKALHQIWLEERYGMDQSNDSHQSLKKKLSAKKATIAYNYDRDDEDYKNKKDESSFSDDSNSEDDYDTTVNIDNLSSDQLMRLNAIGGKFGLKGNDFVRHLEEDKAEAERIRVAKELENEKSMFSGRKSRKERRALKERKMLILRANDEMKPEVKAEVKETSSEAESSDEVDESKIEFITSFGGSSGEEAAQIKEVKKVKKKGKKEKKIAPVVYGPTLPPEVENMLNSQSSSNSRSRSRSRSPGWIERSRIYGNMASEKKWGSSTVKRRIHSSKSPERAKNRSRSITRSRSRSRSRSISRTRSRSKSTSRTRRKRSSRDRIRNRSRSRNRSRFLSRSRSRTRDRDRSTCTRSRSSSPSRSRSRRQKDRSRRLYGRGRSSSRSKSRRRRARSRSKSLSRSSRRHRWSRSRSRSRNKSQRRYRDRSRNRNRSPRSFTSRRSRDLRSQRSSSKEYKGSSSRGSKSEAQMSSSKPVKWDKNMEDKSKTLQKIIDRPENLEGSTKKNHNIKEGENPKDQEKIDILEDSSKEVEVESKEKSSEGGLPHPPIKKYYRHDLVEESESDSDSQQTDVDSRVQDRVSKEATNLKLIATKITGVSKNPIDKLKRQTQALIDKYYKLDKIAEKEKLQKQEQDRIKQDELRDSSKKCRWD